MSEDRKETKDGKEKRDSPFTLALISGAVAGTSVDCALHPMDTLRTRLQSEAGFWKSGGFKGMYKGIFSCFLGSGPGAATFFATYETMKAGMKKANGGNEHWTHHSASSVCGEIGACLVRVPTGVVTQNMQVGHFGSFGEAVSSTYAKNGILGFYRGYTTTVMREIPFSFIQFPIWEALKSTWGAFQGSPTDPNQGALCGSAAGAFSSAVTTPLDVAKTRIMLEQPAEGQPRRYTGAISTLSLIAKEEGLLALSAARFSWSLGPETNADILPQVMLMTLSPGSPRDLTRFASVTASLFSSAI